jgi:LIM homeobox protein 6/8
VRTTFTEEQLQVLQANFEVDSNPDGQDLERIAQITGMINQKKQNLFISLRKIGLRFYLKLFKFQQ